MNLISTVAYLKELEQNDNRAIQYFGELLEYSPALLDVLGMVQEGDAEVLDAIAYHFENLGQHNEWDAKRGAVLRRYATLARKMEEQG